MESRDRERAIFLLWDLPGGVAGGGGRQMAPALILLVSCRALVGLNERKTVFVFPFLKECD